MSFKINDRIEWVDGQGVKSGRIASMYSGLNSNWEFSQCIEVDGVKMGGVAQPRVQLTVSSTGTEIRQIGA